jgi:hypothetical protein
MNEGKIAFRKLDLKIRLCMAASRHVKSMHVRTIEKNETYAAFPIGMKNIQSKLY